MARWTVSGRKEAGERDRVDRDLERLLAVDRDDRDPDPVLDLERVVGLDVDLLELERCPGALGEHDLPSLVAEVTAGAGIEDDVAHGRASYSGSAQKRVVGRAAWPRKRLRISSC